MTTQQEDAPVSRRLASSPGANPHGRMSVSGDGLQATLERLDIQRGGMLDLR